MKSKRLSKKELKRFVKTYYKILDLMCEEYNLKDDKFVEPDGWDVQELVPELAVINHIFIAPPVNRKLDIIKLGKESKSALVELIRVDHKKLCKKKK